MLSAIQNLRESIRDGKEYVKTHINGEDKAYLETLLCIIDCSAYECVEELLLEELCEVKCEVI